MKPEFGDWGIVKFIQLLAGSQLALLSLERQSRHGASVHGYRAILIFGGCRMHRNAVLWCLFCHQVLHEQKKKERSIRGCYIMTLHDLFCASSWSGYVMAIQPLTLRQWQKCYIPFLCEQHQKWSACSTCNSKLTYIMQVCLYKAAIIVTIGKKNWNKYTKLKTREAIPSRFMCKTFCSLKVNMILPIFV